MSCDKRFQWLDFVATRKLASVLYVNVHHVDNVLWEIIHQTHCLILFYDWSYRLLRECVYEILNHNLSNVMRHTFSLVFFSCLIPATRADCFSWSMIKWGNNIWTEKNVSNNIWTEKLMDEKLSWSKVARESWKEQSKKKTPRKNKRVCEEKLLCFLFIERINGFVAPHHTHIHTNIFEASTTFSVKTYTAAAV